MQQLEIGFDETNDKLLKATESLEEKEKTFKEVESDVSALTRRWDNRDIEEDKKREGELMTKRKNIKGRVTKKQLEL